MPKQQKLLLPLPKSAAADKALEKDQASTDKTSVDPFIITEKAVTEARDSQSISGNPVIPEPVTERPVTPTLYYLLREQDHLTILKFLSHPEHTKSILFP